MSINDYSLSPNTSPASVTSLPSTRQFFVGYSSGVLSEWDIETGQSLRVVANGDPEATRITKIVAHPFESLVIIAGVDGSVAYYDPKAVGLMN